VISEHFRPSLILSYSGGIPLALTTLVYAEKVDPANLGTLDPCNDGS